MTRVRINCRCQFVQVFQPVMGVEFTTVEVRLVAAGKGTRVPLVRPTRRAPVTVGSRPLPAVLLHLVANDRTTRAEHLAAVGIVASERRPLVGRIGVTVAAAAAAATRWTDLRSETTRLLSACSAAAI